MANNDLKISEMPLVDGVVEGDVVPAVHNGENVAIKGKFFDNLAKAVGDAVADINAANDSIAELQDEIAGKQDTLTTSADLSISSDNVLSLTDMAKKRLFIDMWNTACGAHGQYNTATGFFELNGLTDITYQQALDIYNAGPLQMNVSKVFCTPIRTNLVYGLVADKGSISLQRTFNLVSIEVASVKSISDVYVITPTSFYLAFFNCRKLKRILGVMDFSKVNYITTSNRDSFANCLELEEIRITKLTYGYNFPDSPKLSLESVKYMVDNAANTGTMTITVHPEVYAKLTDTTDTEWHAVLTAAAAKNISFATV